MNVKSELLKTLDQWIEISKLAKIEWTLAGGSVLGAVRHGGLIPWDDDIDVYIPAASIAKLRASLADNKDLFLLEPFSMQNPNPFFKLTSNKLFGFTEYDKTWEPISIDIFPLVGDRSLYRIAPKFIRRIFNVPRRLLASNWRSRQYAINIVNSLIQRQFTKLVNSKHRGLLRNVFGAYPHKEVVHADTFEKKIEVLFEGRTVYIPDQAHSYLKTLYGDFTKLPPHDRRIAHYKTFKKIADIDLSICVSTKSGLPNDFEFLSPAIGVRYVVINQGTPIDENTNEHVLVINRSDVGLSKSRNTYLKLPEFQSSLIVISDNDVRHDQNLKTKLAPLLLNYDIVTFNNIDHSGPCIRSKIHTLNSVMKIPSWGIAVKNTNLPMFDEQFGLGSKYNNGEENIFLLDCLRRGKRVVHLGEPLVKHEGISTGFIIDYSYFITKGAMLRRMFGIKGIMFLPLFFVRKVASSNLSKSRSLICILNGFFGFRG